MQRVLSRLRAKRGEFCNGHRSRRQEFNLALISYASRNRTLEFPFPTSHQSFDLDSSEKLNMVRTWF